VSASPDSKGVVMICRSCNKSDGEIVLDLGHTPPSNSFLELNQINQTQLYFPLRIFICKHCWLLQTLDFVTSEDVFPESYVYFSSASSTWLEHARLYVDKAIESFSLSRESQVIEIASNDGYLLQYFQQRGIPNLGIEPTASTATKASEVGIETIQDFFGSELARKLSSRGCKADLLIGNNVYAHVPDINDFTAGVQMILKDQGVVTFEFPHVSNILKHNQFDTVYHEHFSYLSLSSAIEIFHRHGLRVFDVETLSTHGGSIRVYGCKQGAEWVKTNNVDNLIREEEADGLFEVSSYQHLQSAAENAKFQLLAFLLDQRKMGRRVVGYGAAAKGNTLLNFAGISGDLIEYVVDGSTSKQGKYLPGSNIPVRSPDSLDLSPGDHVVIFPWNIATEVKTLIANRYGNTIRTWVAIPSMREI
jgi:hypothetical protein